MGFVQFTTYKAHHGTLPTTVRKQQTPSTQALFKARWDLLLILIPTHRWAHIHVNLLPPDTLPHVRAVKLPIITGKVIGVLGRISSMPLKKKGFLMMMMMQIVDSLGDVIFLLLLFVSLFSSLFSLLFFGLQVALKNLPFFSRYFSIISNFNVGFSASLDSL